MREIFRVVAPGPYTTVQDCGRFGYQHMGVPRSGVMDDFAHRVANWLVGNPADWAVLEITFVGPQLEVLGEADIAATGAQMNLTVNGQAKPAWHSIRVRRGDVIRFGQVQNGCRTYLAVTGGVDVPPVMGSRSTYVSGRLGGQEGRPLAAKDLIAAGEAPLLQHPRRLPWFPRYGEEVCLRAVPGPQDECFGQYLELFYSSSFTVASQADRMGYRLQGPAIPRLPEASASIVSEPIVPGNIQVPADGQPIILLAEQTIGGYTKIATVIAPDLFKIAQAKPGDSIRFLRVSLAQSHAINAEWTRYLNEIHTLLAAQKQQSAT